MESPATITKNNTLEEYAASMARTTTRREDFSREKPLQFAGFSQSPTGVYVMAANVPANLTTASYFIPIQGITFETVDTSGLSAPFISPHEIIYSGGATETHVGYWYNHFGLPFGNLGYPEVQFSYQPVVSPEGPWISTPVIQQGEVETIYADTNQTMTLKDLAGALDRISRPTEIEDIPLPFDPDDYPVV